MQSPNYLCHLVQFPLLASYSPDLLCTAPFSNGRSILMKPAKFVCSDSTDNNTRQQIFSPLSQNTSISTSYIPSYNELNKYISRYENKSKYGIDLYYRLCIETVSVTEDLGVIYGVYSDGIRNDERRLLSGHIDNFQYRNLNLHQFKHDSTTRIQTTDDYYYLVHCD